MSLSLDLTKQVFELLKCHDGFAAVALVRQELSLTLKEATNAVHDVELQCFDLDEEGITPFEVIAIGPYSKPIEPYLSYGSELYAKVPEATMVVALAFDIYDCTNLNVYRKAFGLERVGQQLLNPNRINYDALSAQLTEDHPYLNDDDIEGMLEALPAFAAAGFQLFFRVESYDATTKNRTPKETLPWD